LESVTGQLADAPDSGLPDWTSRGLDSPRTSQVADCMANLRMSPPTVVVANFCKARYF